MVKQNQPLPIRWHPSPNYQQRQRPIDMIIIHYTAMESAVAALDRLCDPVAEVSAHYLIDQVGAITHLVADGDCAWHAGESFWQGQTHLNHNSIGIELDNNGTGPFAEVQMQMLESLLAFLIAEYAIPPERILGHADIAPKRKVDPGPFFNWSRLQQRGWGLQLTAPLRFTLEQAYQSSDTEQVSMLLQKIGYKVPEGVLADWYGLKGLQVLHSCVTL